MKDRVLRKLQDSHYQEEENGTDTSTLFRIYGVAVFLGIIASLTASLLGMGLNGYMLLLIPFVLTSAWLGGWKAGTLTTAVMTLGAVLLFAYPQYSISASLLTYTILLFAFFEGLLMSYIIDASHKTSELNEYKKRDRELTDRLTLLEEKFTKAEAEIRARDEFLSIASHELKTPLTSMLMQLQTALHNIRNVSLANFSVENLMKMLDSAEKQSKRLTKMINDLLNISLITTGKLNLEPEEFDLIPLVKDVVQQFSDKAERSGYSFDLDSDKEISVYWDKLRIEQIFTNLISNAMKYGDNKPIKIAVNKHGSSVKIVIADDGIGIPPEKLQHIFGRFERAVTSQEYKGLGVGLYITHQIVTAHGGTIKVESNVGHGTVFIIDIPIKKLPQN